MRRLRWALAVALVGLSLSVPAQAALAPCGPGGSTEAIGGGWIASAPNYPSGHGETTFVASPAFDPNLIFVSNGSVVMRSVDAGCGWALVYSGATVAGAVPGSKVEITALAVPSSANNSRYVYVGMTRRQVGEVSEPLIVVSSDRGGRFELHQSGLPLAGTVTGLAANAQVPEVAYATVDLDLVGSGASVFATTDAGATWTQRTPTGDSFAGTELTTHPTTQTDLFAVRDGQVVRSSNGGITFEAASPESPVQHLSGAPGAGGLRLVAGRVDGGVEASTSLGESWMQIASPVSATSVAVAPLQDVVAVSGDRGTFLVTPTLQDVSPSGPGPRDLAITAPTAKGYAITGMRGGTMVRLSVDPAGRPIVPPVGPDGRVRPVTLLPPGPVTQFPSLILPSALRVSLAAGESRLIPYRMLVPRTPTPVDVLFAVDSTNSMAGVIEDMRAGLRDIVNSLNGAGLNVRVGVGDFRDYPAPAGPASRGDWPWRLGRAIGPVDAELEAALNAVRTGGGTEDGRTSGYAAMYQSTTGNDILDGVVEPIEDANANYRRGSLRLAMLASDAPSHEGGVRGQPGPDADQTIAALRRHDVHVIGLAVPGGVGDPARYMRELAEGSSTFAPAGGVDCDGNGVVDLEEGEPLVCRLASAGTAAAGIAVTTPERVATGLTAAVVGLAAGIPDIKPVGVRVAKGGSFAVLRSTSRVVNLRADNELPFTLELRCPVAPGSRQQIELVGATANRVLASGSVDLTCGGLPVAAPAAAVMAAVPPPAPAPAQPVPQPQPQPNPNPNPNPNPAVNINVNPGVADQQEQEPQLAMAESSEQETASMSALAFVAAAGLLTCTAGGLALRRREELSLQR